MRRLVLFSSARLFGSVGWLRCHTVDKEDSIDLRSASTHDAPPMDTPFDEVEAACQDIHDLTIAMERHLRNVHHKAKDYDSYASLKKADLMFNKWSQQLMAHLTSEVVDRLMLSAKRKGSIRGHRSRLVDRCRWTSSQFRTLMMHAPFELESLRSDINPELVKDARCTRDEQTMNSLMRLTSESSSIRCPLESRMWTLLQRYDKCFSRSTSRTP